MTSMTAEFLQTLRTNPDNDKNREVVADWLEHEGDLDRANFIRLQLQRASLDRWDPRAIRIELDERALLRDCEAVWRSELPKLDGVRWGPFRRGFVDKVAFDDVATLVEHGATCLAAGPVSSLAIPWPRLDDWPELCSLPGVRELTVVGTLLAPDDMAWLADSDLLATVETLNLVETKLTSEGLAYLLASPHLSRLRALRMPLHEIENEGLERLVQASMPGLRDLDLSAATVDELVQPTLDAEAMRVLAAWPVLGQLTALNLNGNEIGADGLRALLCSDYTANLKVLHLRSNSHEDIEPPSDTLHGFDAAHDAMRLEQLDIGGNEFNDDAAHLLANSPALRELACLGLDELRADLGFETLTAAPWFDSLRFISARDDNDNSRLLRAIMERSPRQLHTLEVTSWYIHESQTAQRVTQTLAAGPALPSLLVLNLFYPDHDEIEILTTLGSIFPNLLSLRLGRDPAHNWDEDNDDDDDHDHDHDDHRAALAKFAESTFGQSLLSLTTDYAELDKLRAPARVVIGRGEYRGPLRFL